MRKTARELLDAEGVKLSNYAEGKHRSACPICAREKTRSDDNALDVKIDELGFQLRCYRCGWETFGFYIERNAEEKSSKRRSTKPVAACAPDDSRKIEHVMVTLKGTQNASGTLVETYLNNRAIMIVPDCIRFSPALWHSDLKRKFAAMVCPLRDIKTNAVCGYHKTYLEPDGSRKITNGTARKMFGRAKGAVVKLTPDNQVEQGLCIGEGVETCLSLMQAGFPIWAAGSADGIREFPVLSGIECLTIFSDPDPVGMAAAEACAQRWLEGGQEARILTPATGGGSHDWNDHARRAA